MCEVICKIRENENVAHWLCSQVRSGRFHLLRWDSFPKVCWWLYYCAIGERYPRYAWTISCRRQDDIQAVGLNDIRAFQART